MDSAAVINQGFSIRKGATPTIDRRRVMLIFGTRPEAIKMAPVVHALKNSQDFSAIVTVTGQHRSMLDQVLDTFEISPDHDLDVIKPKQTLFELTTNLINRLDKTLEESRPDVVLVQGDTATTFTSALAAFYHRIPVVHLEAGMRTGDLNHPFPEEMNRILTTRLSTLHLAATARARSQLIAEGVPLSSIIVTGNTVIDALNWTLNHHQSLAPSLVSIASSSRPLLLVTAHRRESWGEPMRELASAIADVAAAEPNLMVLFPVHPNPIVADTIHSILDGLPNVTITEPLDYPDFVVMMQRATIILSDSGGVQEEAPSLGTPVLVMREKTERPEAVEAGAAQLVGTNRQRISGAVLQLLHDQHLYSSMARAINPYGDGHAAERVLASLRHLLYGAPAPDDFAPPQGRASLPVDLVSGSSIDASFER